MKDLVRLRMRPSRDRKSFRYMLDYVDREGKRRQVSLGHADKRQVLATFRLPAYRRCRERSASRLPGRCRSAVG